MSDMPEEIKKQIPVPKEIYQGVPSPSCPQGAKGRKGVFEIIEKTQ